MKVHIPKPFVQLNPERKRCCVCGERATCCWGDRELNGYVCSKCWVPLAQADAALNHPTKIQNGLCRPPHNAGMDLQ